MVSAPRGAANWKSPTRSSIWWTRDTRCSPTYTRAGGSIPAKPARCWEANCLVLDELAHCIEGYVDRDSQLNHKVTIQQGAEIINSRIRGPAIIGENTRIVNAYVGPYTAIYHDVLIEDSEIEHSIVLEHSQIVDIPQRIEDSLIGRNVEIKRSPLKPKAHKMTLGDNSRVGIL